MGIVVMIAMALAGIYLLSGRFEPLVQRLHALGIQHTIIGLLSITLGIWNSLWGLINIGGVWGVISLICGPLLTLSGVRLAWPLLTNRLGLGPRLERTRQAVDRFRLPLGYGLLGFALVYLIGIVQLNLPS